MLLNWLNYFWEKFYSPMWMVKFPLELLPKPKPMLELPTKPHMHMEVAEQNAPKRCIWKEVAPMFTYVMECMIYSTL